MKYGRHDTITELDQHGSTKTTSAHYREGKMTGNTKEYYEIRHQVGSPLEEMAQFSAFHREFSTDKTMLDPQFKIEGKGKGDKWYTVNCFTRIVR